MTADSILAIAAVITALAGLIKAFWSAKDLDDLKETIKEQGQKIAALEKENKDLCSKIETLESENEELREQNKVVNAVNAELRKLLDAKMHR
jgi:predicted nuclease with TOPRIM domain